MCHRQWVRFRPAVYRDKHQVTSCTEHSHKLADAMKVDTETVLRKT